MRMKSKTILKILTVVAFMLAYFNLQGQTKGNPIISNDIYNIIAFGAKPDGKTLNTQAIQKTIDECFSRGGGTVLIPPGTFLTGSISLKSHVLLYLSKNAVLLASGNIADYSTDKEKLCAVLIDSVEDVSITGDGIINGQGGLFTVAESAPNRPWVVLVYKSRNIRIEKITLKNSACWTLGILGSEHIFITGLSVYSHSNFNNDGIDVIDTKDAVISDCIIDCDDDALCFKTTAVKQSCENVAVTNCILASNCNFIKFGTASRGGFKNISINNCVLRHASESNRRNWYESLSGVTDTITGISGIALEVVDGGFMDQIAITNITMDGVQTPIFLRLGSRRNPVGSLKNVIISNIVATTHSRIPCIISGVPGFYIENVLLKDMFIQCKGGGEATDVTSIVPENENYYPENRMFGSNLPAYGLYVRHARNIEINNVQFDLLQSDFRPALWFDDAQEIKVRNFKASKPSGTYELIIKKPTDNVIIEK